jgi:hypothetical protein
MAVAEVDGGTTTGRLPSAAADIKLCIGSSLDLGKQLFDLEFKWSNGVEMI